MTSYPDDQPGTPRPEGFVLGPDEGEGYWWWGALSVNKVTASSTRGGLDVVDHRLPLGYAPPPHVHDDSDEVFFITDGLFSVRCDGKEWEAGPGSLVFLPAGSVHGFTVIGDGPARNLIITARASFAGLVADLGTPTTERTLPPPGVGDVSMEAMAQASQKWGIRYDV